MSTASTDRPTDAASPHYSRSLLLLLATIAGVSVANIYYNQPLLDSFRSAFPDGASWIGAVPTATQLGYAAGMFLLAPLGDRFDRRGLILMQIAGLSIALIVAATAPSLAVLAVASLAIGVLATIAQQAVPFAAEIAPPAERGHAVGTVMSGLLLGILLARTAAGFVAEYFGWRAVFAASVAALVALAAVIVLRLPRSSPTSTLSYGKLLGSMWHLAVELRGLREASLTGAALFAAFSAFWPVLTLLLAGAPFHLGPQAAGLFGIVGAAGALAAPYAGRFADKRGPRAIISLAIVVILVIATKALTGRGTPLRGGLPSGHAAVAFAAWMAVTQMLDPSEHRFLISMIMLGVASLVAYSRIETGIHSALEVVYGGLLGAGVTLLVFQVFG